MKSSHPNYEKTVKEFISKNFPNRFASYREYYAAATFRRKMLEHDLWEGPHGFISWANNHCDFAKAATIDAGNIYRSCSLVAKKLLQFANPQGQSEYGWANIAMSVLKCCVPTADVMFPDSLESKCIPYIFEKASDCEKIDLLFAPMQDARASRAPEKPEQEACQQMGMEWESECPGLVSVSRV